MTGNPYFGLRFYGVKNLVLGAITMNLSSGLGIRFDRDGAANSNVKMGTIRVTGASSHAVETFNIDKLDIDAVYATNCGESGLLIQTSTNVWVGLVNGNNVGAGTGYGTLRFANRNGRLSSGAYTTNGTFSISPPIKFMYINSPFKSGSTKSSPAVAVAASSASLNPVEQ